MRSALRYVRRTPELLIPLAMMALVGTISFNFQVLLPLLADFTWHGTASTYALLTAAMGVGSVAGALAAGARGRVSGGLLVVASGLFGVVLALAAVAPTLELQVLALVPLGAASVTFAAGVNSTLQVEVEPVMRGRVMALYSIVFLGSTPIGAPLVGWLAEVAGPRAGLWAGAVACWWPRRALPSRSGAPRGIVARAMTSPLETVSRNHGAVISERGGRRVPVSFGSTAAEEAVCQKGVGMADRSDRDTFELRGDPVAIETALTELGPLVWASFIGADRALVRCAAESTAEVSDVLAHYGDVAVKARTARTR